jgi:uncharacterized protein (TIGR00369 family)
MSEPERTDHERRERALNFQFTRVPAITLLGMQLESWDETSARVRLPFREQASNGGGSPHGGIVASLLDTAGAAAIWAGHDFSRGTRGATVSLAINYLGAATNEDLIAEARCTKRGRDMHFAAISVTSDSGKPIADGVITYRIVA